MDFGFDKLFKALINIAFDVPQKSKRRELGDDYDFREDYESEVEEWEDKVNEMNYICSDWTYEHDPVPFRKKFDEYYEEVITFLKDEVKPFLASHSKGYRKALLNNIYKELLEEAKENRKDFLENEYPYMQEEYKDYLKELRMEEKERQKEEKARAAMLKTIIKKLTNCQPIKQKTFLSEFDDLALVKDIINEQINLGNISREKKGGAYILALTPKEIFKRPTPAYATKEAVQTAIISTLKAIQAQKLKN